MEFISPINTKLTYVEPFMDSNCVSYHSWNFQRS